MRPARLEIDLANALFEPVLLNDEGVALVEHERARRASGYLN